MFDELARSVASTLSGVFGGIYPYSPVGQSTVDVPLVLRKDVELLDDAGQVVGRADLVRIAFDDIAFTPKRDDYFVADGVTYIIGKRVADDGYAYVYEVTS